MLIRVRTNVGIWRVDNLDESTAYISDILEGIAKTRPNVKYEKPLSLDPACSTPLSPHLPLTSQTLSHGSMIYTHVDPTTASATSTTPTSTSNNTTALTSSASTRKTISKDGSIQLQYQDPTTTPTGTHKGFRKGTLALRDMKMAWTLHEFVAMDEQYIFKIKRQEESWVTGGVSLDTPSCEDFQLYLSQFQFKRSRFGFLYGRFDGEEEEEKKKGDGDGDGEGETNAKKKVIVECIYEPPQIPDPDTPEGFQVLDDPNEERVEHLAEMLGLKKVGWIFGHPSRSKEIHLSGAEIIMAAEFQLEAAGGVEPTPFVTVKVTAAEDDGQVSFEAFQVSLQCMEMAAEEALEVVEDHQQVCRINETFTAIQEGKESKTVDTNFFLTVVPIVQHVSDTFVCQFPKANRDGVMQTHDIMKTQLQKSGRDGWTFLELLSDFGLLLYLCDFLDYPTDLEKICKSVVDKSVPLDDGYKILIASLAGMDGSY